jgi:allantoin racemase
VRLKAIVPFPLDAKAVELRSNQIPPRFREEVEEVQYVAVRNSGRLADSYYESLLMDAYIAAEGVHAEDEGFDAVIVDTVSDSGVEALRSRLKIPVVGPGHASFHIAALLGRRFTVLSIWRGWEFGYRRNLRRYGMEGHLASLRSLDKKPDLEGLLSDDPQTIAELATLAETAVEEDGADVIVMGSTTMYQAVPTIARTVDVPVIDPGVWAFALAVDLVKAGISHSKRAYAPPETAQDAIFDLLPSRDQTAAIGGADV